MEKYINANHQNLVVWSRRAGIEFVDADKRLATLDKYFGTGRRAVLRMIGVRLTKDALGELPREVQWYIGHAIGDLVYTMAYTEEVIENQHTWVGKWVVDQCSVDTLHATQVAAQMVFICRVALALYNKRVDEYTPRPSAGALLAKAIVRRVNGR